VKKKKLPWKQRNQAQQKLYQQQYYLDGKRKRLEAAISAVEMMAPKDDIGKRLRVNRLKELKARLAQTVLKKRELTAAL